MKITQFIIFFFIFLFMSSFFSCENSDNDFILALGDLSGNISIDSTFDVIEGASVLVNGNAVLTDSNGYYELKDLSAGTHEVVVSYHGYDSDTGSVFIRIDENTQYDANLRETTTGTIAGIVLISGTSEGIEGASIRLNGNTVTSTDEGNYVVYDIPQGRYLLEVSHPDYESISDSVTITIGEELVHNVQLVRNGATLSVSTKILDFGNSASRMSFRIENTNNAISDDNLSWRIFNDIEGISLSDSVGDGEKEIFVNMNRELIDVASNNRLIVSNRNSGASKVVTIAAE